LSGDTFAVILPEKNKKQANTIAEALRQRVEAFGISGGPGYPRNFVTVSGGVSENPIDGVTADELIKKASSALNDARSRGKNLVIS
jgi:diguanylate cyclase (GGDEF)-like protein